MQAAASRSAHVHVVRSMLSDVYSRPEEMPPAWLASYRHGSHRLRIPSEDGCSNTKVVLQLPRPSWFEHRLRQHGIACPWAGQDRRVLPDIGGLVEIRPWCSGMASSQRGVPKRACCVSAIGCPRTPSLSASPASPASSLLLSFHVAQGKPSSKRCRCCNGVHLRLLQRRGASASWVALCRRWQSCWRHGATKA